MTFKRLHDFVRSFEVERLTEPLRSSSWNLELVLRALRSDSYEPMAILSPRTFTKKTFLWPWLQPRVLVNCMWFRCRLPFKAMIVFMFLCRSLVKTETASNFLPRSCVVNALLNFVGYDD